MGRQPAEIVRSARFASRRKEVRHQARKRRRRVTFATITLIALATGGWFLSRSSLFALEGIEVAGTKLLTPAEVVQASGLHRGQSMLGLHTDQVRARIASLPLVRSVTVRRVPTARVRITVTERAPSFILETVEGRWLMDDTGVILGVADGTASLPTISVAGAPSAGTGDRLQEPDVRNAMELWAALPRSLRTSGATIQATADSGLMLVRSGSTIVFGTMDRLAQKLRSVRLVMNRVGRMGRNIVRLDVRSPERPAATLH